MPDNAPAAGWEPAEHACRFCGGRIMKRRTEHRCWNCSAGTAGPVTNICGCGISATGGFAPFRCERNPAPSQASPAEIIIVRADPQKKGPAKR